MFGKNPILKPIKGDGNQLQVKSIFSTFQGEGIYTGYSSIFIRLGGCNLACSFCDTDFDNFDELSLDDILQKVENLSKETKNQPELIVITGGEPLRQPISKLCEALLKKGFLIQIETNGTLYQELPREVKIICSPKNVDGKYYKIRPDLLKRIDAFKFLISTKDEKYSTIPKLGQSEYDIPVYLQPIDEYDDEINKKNHQKTLQLAQNNNCRISLQTHKIWDIE